MATWSPSVRNHTSDTCGRPSGPTVARVAKSLSSRSRWDAGISGMVLLSWDRRQPIAQAVRSGWAGGQGEAGRAEPGDERGAHRAGGRQDAGQAGQPVLVEGEAQRALAEHHRGGGVAGIS